jgi:hypothetical protein
MVDRQPTLNSEWFAQKKTRSQKAAGPELSEAISKDSPEGTD